MGSKLLAVLLTAGLVLAIVGCGGDNDSDTSAAGSNQNDASETARQVSNTDPAKAQFISEATKACKNRANNITKRGNKLFIKYGGINEEDVFGEHVIKEVLVPEFEAEISDLEALTPPPGDQGEIDAILAAIHKFIKQLETDPSAEGYYPYKKAERLAKQYGIPTCGTPERRK